MTVGALGSRGNGFGRLENRKNRQVAIQLIQKR